MQRILAEHQPLWLQFDHSHKLLPMAPWEELLRGVGTGVLRLPYYTLFPAFPPDPLDVAICVSSPMAKEPIPIEDVVHDLVVSINEALPRRVSIHIFTDVEAVGRVHSRLGPLMASGIGPVAVHYPHEAASFATERTTSRLVDIPGRLDNPWLRWMKDALQGKSIDVVHFVCHGHLSAGQGAIALAVSPTRNDDELWSRFVGANQLSLFMHQVGGYSCAFTSPLTNYSKSALRLLADQLAQLRPISAWHRTRRRVYPGRHSTTPPGAFWR